MSQSPQSESFDLIRRDLVSHSRSIGELVKEQATVRDFLHEVKTDRAVRTERDAHINQRFDRIEKSINELKSIGKWILMSFGATLIAALVTFIVRGGLSIVP